MCMIKSQILSLLILTVAILSACASRVENELKTFQIAVENTLDSEREDVFVHIPLESISGRYPDFNPKGYRVFHDGTEIPSQFNSDGLDKGLIVILPKVLPKEKILLELGYDSEKDIENNYPKRTQAELSHKFNGYFENRKYIGGEFRNVNELHVPAEHTDHSWYIRYEGPGWESDKVRYRFYLDWRNGVDVFGKTVSEPILRLVGQDGFDSYHEMQDWGMDVLKVGKTLGVGSIATFIDGKARRIDVTDSLYAAITNNGPVYSSVLTKYHGWDLGYTKTDITSEISIHAGTRVSQQVLKSSGPIENFATGLIKDPKAELIMGGEAMKYGYLATYGPQSLAGDNLGIAVIFPNDRKMEITDDGLSHIVVLRPENHGVTYYFLAAWEQEKNGIKTKEQFIDHLNVVVNQLSNPVSVNLK